MRIRNGDVLVSLVGSKNQTKFADVECNPMSIELNCSCTKTKTLPMFPSNNCVSSFRLLHWRKSSCNQRFFFLHNHWRLHKTHYIHHIDPSISIQPPPKCNWFAFYFVWSRILFQAMDITNCYIILFIYRHRPQFHRISGHTYNLLSYNLLFVTYQASEIGQQQKILEYKSVCGVHVLFFPSLTFFSHLWKRIWLRWKKMHLVRYSYLV